MRFIQHLHTQRVPDVPEKWKVVGGLLAHVRSLKEPLDDHYSRGTGLRRKRFGYKLTFVDLIFSTLVRKNEV